jgi:hypothetical protein
MSEMTAKTNFQLATKDYAIAELHKLIDAASEKLKLLGLPMSEEEATIHVGERTYELFQATPTDEIFDRYEFSRLGRSIFRSDVSTMWPEKSELEILNELKTDYPEIEPQLLYCLMQRCITEIDIEA